MTRGAGRNATSALARVVLVAILGMGAAAFVLPAAPADAAPTITFHDCEQSPSPSPTASPTATPEDDPGADGCIPVEGQAVRGSHTLRFTVTAASSPFQRTLQSVELYVLSEQEGVAHPNAGQPVRTWEYDFGETTEETLTYEWDTTRLTPHNGEYRIRVEATEYGTSSTSAERERAGIKIDNPPGTPKAPSILEVGDDGPVVEWAKAPEPDILSYSIYRARSSSGEEEPGTGAYERVATVGCDEAPCRYADEVDGGGAYWYQVRVTRVSVVTPEDGISSRRSAPSEPAVVEGPADDEGALREDGRDTRVGPERTQRDRLRSRSLNRPTQRPAPGSDDSFSMELPYDAQNGGDGASFQRPAEVADEEGSRQGLVAAAIGALLVAGGLAIGRTPV